MNATAGPSHFPGSLSSDAHGEFFFSLLSLFESFSFISLSQKLTLRERPLRRENGLTIRQRTLPNVLAVFESITICLTTHFYPPIWIYRRHSRKSALVCDPCVITNRFLPHPLKSTQFFHDLVLQMSPFSLLLPKVRFLFFSPESSPSTDHFLPVALRRYVEPLDTVSFGSMKYTCSYCHAYHWMDEKTVNSTKKIRCFRNVVTKGKYALKTCQTHHNFFVHCSQMTPPTQNTSGIPFDITTARSRLHRSPQRKKMK
jgi:hypothetical protein